MKKILFAMGVLLLGTVFNFATEAKAEKHEYLDQNATAYVGKTDGHGSSYGYYNQQYNTVAVKKWTTNEPYIPFGTVITLTETLTLTGTGNTRKQFTVTDTGPGTGKSPYWIDVYYGLDTITNKQNAFKFGMDKIVSYSASF